MHFQPHFPPSSTISIFDFELGPTDSAEVLKAMPITELESEDQYKTRFADIKKGSSNFVNCSIGNLLKNEFKNRYSDVVPSDDEIFHFENSKFSNYINASWYGKEAILTQGPKFNTIRDFWLMAFESNASIICVTDQFHNNTEKTANYWDPVSTFIPTEDSLGGNSVDEAYIEIKTEYALDHEFTDGEIKWNFKVKPIGNHTVLDTHGCQKIICSEFEVSLGEEIKIIPRIYFENWPDNGVCNPTLLAKFIHLIPQDNTPIIHCSAGIGRSGVVAIAKHFIDAYNNDGKIPTENEIDEEIIKLRKARPGAVQTYEQRKLITETILEYIPLSEQEFKTNPNL